MRAAKARNGPETMPTVRFLGRVHPPVYSITVTDGPMVAWENPQTGLAMQFVCQIHQSSIEVNCELNREMTADDFGDLYCRALDLCPSTVHLIGFQSGYALSVFHLGRASCRE